MKGSSRSVRNALLLIVACSLLGGIFGAQGRERPATPSKESDVEASIRLFTKVLSVAEENYADRVDAEKAVYYGAIPGMLRTLDPHSIFLDPKMYAQQREDQRGKYYGVGMTVGQRDGQIIVIALFPGSPAHRGGIRPGDFIIQVDAKPTTGLSTLEVSELLRGPKGTPVRVRVQREGSPQPLEFAITRDEIPRHSVEQAFEIQPGIAYVKITNFLNEATSRELAEALKNLDVSRLKGLVLDLRGNTGGLLNEGIRVADMFLQRSQVIVTHRGRASEEKVYRATTGNRGLEYPLVVLVDRFSASASEIVAGAVQDHDRGLVVGETSFGKGLVQNVYPLSDNTGLALTIARYYTPSGRLIQRNYNHVSLYNYYSQRGKEEESRQSQDVKNTDGGRLVYGGGGITPDVKISPPKLARFQTLLESKYAFFNFAKAYLAVHNTILRDFEVNAPVMEEFRTFLDREKISYSEDDLRENRDFMARHIRQDLLTSVFNKTEGDRIQIESDPVVLKALEVMPQARALTENARKVLAQRRGQ